MTYLFTAFAISIGLYMVSVDKIRAAKNKEPDCPMACFVITGCTCCCCAPCLWLCLCFGARPPPSSGDGFVDCVRAARFGADLQACAAEADPADADPARTSGIRRRRHEPNGRGSG